MFTIALIWGVFWGVLGPLLTAALALVIGASGPFSGPLSHVWGLIVSFAVLGAGMGVGFSGLIALLGRRKGWGLTRGRALLLGAGGGVVVYGLYLAVLLVVNLEGGPIPAVLPVVMIASLGAITGVLTFGTAARGSLPAPPGESKRIAE